MTLMVDVAYVRITKNSVDGSPASDKIPSPVS